MEILTQCLACYSPNFSAHIQTSAMMHPQSNERFNFDCCENCGLIFLNPRVPESALAAYYSADYLPYRIEAAWGKYAAFVKRDQANIDKKRVDLVQKHVHLQNNSRVLDIGCGKPTFLAALKKVTDAQLIGLDFSEHGWANERDLFKNLDLRAGEIDDLANEKAVDLMTMWHYLEHDYRPQETLRKLLNIAHAGTKLIIEVPNFDSDTRKKFGVNWSGFHTPRHTALYSIQNLEKMLSRNGWVVEKSTAFGTLDPYTLDWMSRMEAQKIDWSASMESKFFGYVGGMILRWPWYGLQRFFSQGFMTVVATPSGKI